MLGSHARRYSILAVLIAAPLASADTLRLADGSRIEGELRAVTREEARMSTAFADELAVPSEQIAGITTDEKRFVTLRSGDRVEGRLVYEGDTQRIRETSFGEVTTEAGEIAAVSGPEADEPAEVRAAEAEQRARERVKKAEKKAEKARAHAEKTAKELAEHADPWSGTFELGFSGETGNTDRTSFRGRASAERETPTDTLSLFAQGRWASEDGERTTNEIRGGARLDVNVSERWFLFGKAGLEFDEFENLDLRSTLTTGVGYTLIDKEKETLKLRAGGGYRHESFMNGTSQDEGIVELGYNYAIDVNEWLGITHGITVEPSLTETGEFRVEHETAAEVPLSKEKAWKLRLSVENQFDSDPQPGIDELDTSYLASLVYDWE